MKRDRDLAKEKGLDYIEVEDKDYEDFKNAIEEDLDEDAENIIELAGAEEEEE